MNRRYWVAVIVVATAAIGLAASPAAAHGVGEGGHLPIRWWQFLYAAGFALIITFLWLALSWTTPRLAGASIGHSIKGSAIPLRLGGLVLQIIGLVVFVVTWSAGWIGDDSTRNNLAPTMAYVALWGAMPLVTAVFGNIWSAISPFETLASLWERIARRRTARPARDAESGTESLVWSHWPAALGLGGFIWFEICYHAPTSPRSLAMAITLYSVAVMAMAVRYGRTWLRTGEAFGVLFAMIALLSPFGRRDDGRLQIRRPFTGLATFHPRRGSIAVFVVMIGGSAFDGVTRMQWWANVEGDATGWGRTVMLTFGLVWATGIVAVMYLGVTTAIGHIGNTEPNDGPSDYAHTLIPVVLALALTHYFALVLIEGQAVLALISNPYGRDWNLFGTAGRVVDVGVVSAGTVAWVQLLAMAIGHGVALAVAHDRALETHHPRLATRTQYPMLALMGVFALGGLALLLEG